MLKTQIEHAESKPLPPGMLFHKGTSQSSPVTSHDHDTTNRRIPQHEPSATSGIFKGYALSTRRRLEVLHVIPCHPFKNLITHINLEAASA